MRVTPSLLEERTCVLLTSLRSAPKGESERSARIVRREKNPKDSSKQPKGASPLDPHILEELHDF